MNSILCRTEVSLKRIARDYHEGSQGRTVSMPESSTSSKDHPRCAKMSSSRVSALFESCSGKPLYLGVLILSLSLQLDCTPYE